MSISAHYKTPFGEGNGNPLPYLAWKIPWMEEPGGYSPWGRKELHMTERLTHSQPVCKFQSISAHYKTPSTKLRQRVPSSAFQSTLYTIITVFLLEADKTSFLILKKALETLTPYWDLLLKTITV